MGARREGRRGVSEGESAVNLDAILGERLAILGGTGSGKSYAARGLAERILARGDRLGVIDPTGVWWGIRSEFPVVLFGGDHADLPLTEHAGRVVAQAVATSRQSWIIDTSALQTKAAERRFMLDFLDSLFAANRAPITLIVDEADRFSPQRMSPETTRLHERMEEIVRRGRVRGFCPWLITQRPASLNKDVLSQATALICMRMTGAQDRSAIGDVIEGQADKATAKAIVDAMPRHKVGEGMVWAPMQGILLPAKFPQIKTFDSMSADTAHKHANQKLPPIDVDALKEQLVLVETETKANDPKELKKRIAELERQLKAKVPVSDERAEQAAYSAGCEAGVAWALDRVAARNNDAMSRLRHLQSELGALHDAINAPIERPKKLPPAAAGTSPTAPKAQPSQRPVPVPTRHGAEANGRLPKAERLILTVLAQRNPNPVPIERVAAIAGYAVNGGGFRNSLGALRTAGYIGGDASGLVITHEGAIALGTYDPLPTGADLLRYWQTRVGKAERAILDGAAAGLTSVDAIAHRGGYAPDGGGFRNALGKLRTLGLISGRGVVELHEDLR